MKKENDVTSIKKDIFKFKERQSAVNIILVILILFALLISVMAVGVNLAKEPIKGEKGETGKTGLAGKDGEDGKNTVFEYEINGTYIRFRNVTFKNNVGHSDSYSEWIDLKGDKGDTGERGPPGLAGSGRDGKDCINKKPVITLNNITGFRISKCTEFTFRINISITDPDNDYLQVDFYVSEELNGSWIHHNTFFGVNGVYSSIKTFYYSYTVMHKSLYWCVRVWDGSDISLGYFDVVV